jgi:hypothetical protein
MISRLSQGVIPSGFEPETYRLEICCSIQLSYRTICKFRIPGGVSNLRRELSDFAVQICKNLLKPAMKSCNFLIVDVTPSKNLRFRAAA